MFHDAIGYSSEWNINCLKSVSFLPWTLDVWIVIGIIVKVCVNWLSGFLKPHLNCKCIVSSNLCTGKFSHQIKHRCFNSPISVLKHCLFVWWCVLKVCNANKCFNFRPLKAFEKLFIWNTYFLQCILCCSNDNYFPIKCLMLLPWSHALTGLYDYSKHTKESSALIFAIFATWGTVWLFKIISYQLSLMLKDLNNMITSLTTCHVWPCITLSKNKIVLSNFLANKQNQSS